MRKQLRFPLIAAFCLTLAAVSDPWRGTAQLAMTTIAGTGASAYSGDGGPATTAELNAPEAVYAYKGDLYICDFANCRIRKMDLSTGIISLVAGGGASIPGDGMDATDGSLSGPGDICVHDSALYIADYYRRFLNINHVWYGGNWKKSVIMQTFNILRYVQF